jgi:hypothetical protein
MERSEAVTAVLARIMKMLERSNESLLGSINQFEGASIGAIAGPTVPQPRADIGVLGGRLLAVPGSRHSSNFGQAAGGRNGPE